MTWRRALSVFWLVTWRVIVFAMLFGFVLVFPDGFVGAMFNPVTVTSGAVGMVACIGWGLLVIRMALRKKYKNFRIVLVANS